MELPFTFTGINTFPLYFLNGALSIPAALHFIHHTPVYRKRLWTLPGSASIMRAIDRRWAMGLKPEPISDRPALVLAIDGGGIRGIIPGMILENIRQSLGHEIYEAFDLISGTSTG